MRTLALVTVLISGCASPRHDATTQPAQQAAAIEWNAWAPEAFARAEREDRMLIIDVGMEGCTACRWMDEKTYAHPDVAALIDEHFVAISVDAEARPDIGERYEYWAWPATIFMSPDGEQVLAIRGNKLPKNFIPILQELIEHKSNGTLTGDGKQPITAPPRKLEGPLEDLRKAVVAQMDRRYDAKQGGWGSQKAVAKAHIAHAFLRAHARNEEQWRERALHTLKQTQHLIDPEWGGVFVASFDGWTSAVPEKRIAGQAAALRGFAEANAITGEDAWLDHARAVDRYVRSTFLAPNGTFYTSQEDDAPSLPEGMNARQYFALPASEREQYGKPPVDHAVYTHKNAEAIRAYVALATASGDKGHLAIATKAAKTLIDERQTEAGLFRQFSPNAQVQSDDRMRALPEGDRAYLLPQGLMGLALIDLYRTTGEDAWRQSAVKLANGLLAQLQDPKVGGFFDTDDASTDHIAPRRKSVEANAQAGQFLYLLSVYEKSDAYRKAAEDVVRAVAHPDVLRREGLAVADLATLLDLLLTGYVEFTVVGDAKDPRAAKLRAAADSIYEPRKVLHAEAPGRYPDQGQPAVFVCSDNACSPPITEPKNIAAAAARFAGLK